MIFNEDIINKNAELALCNLNERKDDVRDQINRIRELYAEIDHRDDTGQSTTHQINALNVAISRLSDKRQQYKRSFQTHRRWRERAALFQKFKTDYESAGRDAVARVKARWKEDRQHAIEIAKTMPPEMYRAIRQAIDQSILAGECWKQANKRIHKALDDLPVSRKGGLS